jgi:hypothetical protein
MAFYHCYSVRHHALSTDTASPFTFSVYECCLNVKFDNNSVKARPSVSKNLVSKGVLMYALSCQTSRRVTGTASFLARTQTNEINNFAVSCNRLVDMFQGRYENHIYENLYRYTHE